MAIFKYLLALTAALLLSLAPAAYAQTPAPPPSSINFAGMTYNLVISEPVISEPFDSTWSMWRYTTQGQGPQQSHAQELLLTWKSNEFISDAFDAKSCPQLKDEPIFSSLFKDPSWFVTYTACGEIFNLEDEEPGVIHVHTDQREILLTSIITGGDVERGEFVKLTISRYIPVPIPHHDKINGLLHYAYTITAYGPPQEQAVVLLERLNQEGEQWLNAMLKAPVPQFILDRARYYQDCHTRYGSESNDRCPW